MEGYLTLIKIKLPTQGLFQNEEHTYEGVQGVFCHISWELQNQKPILVPMFKDLQEKSPLCQATQITMDFHDVADKARAFDRNEHNFTTTQKSRYHQVVQPKAVIFHETRCGSTLVSNLLTTSLPEQTKTYSEAQPPLMALMACDILSNQGKYCDQESQVALIRDVFYMMGRMTRPKKPQHLFFKMQSMGSRYIDIFSEAMPSTQWAFIFRDSVEILMSHLSYLVKGDSAVENDPTPVCLRDYRKANQHSSLREVVAEAGRNVTSLTKEEYCAAHVASLAQSAIQEYNRLHPTGLKKGNYNRKQWFLNYEGLPHVLWEEWMPYLHMGYMEKEMKERMQQMANLYSKNRGQDVAQPWHEDSTMKRSRAPESVKKAVELFLDPVYSAMNEIQASQT